MTDAVDQEAVSGDVRGMPLPLTGVLLLLLLL